MQQKYSDKDVYLAYRETAQRLAKERPMTVHITEHAPVHRVEGGAYVEGMVWVPEAELPKREPVR